MEQANVDGLVKSRKTDFLPQHISIIQDDDAICCGQNKMLGLFTRPSMLTLLNFRDKSELNRLKTAFGGIPPYYDIPFLNALFVLEQNGCTDVIIEKDYINKDYLDEFSFFYSTTFKTYGRFCTRLHFFKGNLIKSFGISGGSGKIEDFTMVDRNTLQNAYLGFIVIRPIEKNKLGRTIIQPYIKNDNEEFVLSQTSCEVNLHGINLTAKGMPFIQQDTQAGVCASASQWMLVRYAHEKFGFKQYTLPSITALANRFLNVSRPFPATKGLNICQIVSSLIQMDFAPIVYDRVPGFSGAKLEELKEIVYHYLESELPVILIINASHVCLVIGHDFRPQIKPRKTSKCIKKNLDYIHHLIVHDDELGPYLRMPIEDSNVKNANFFDTEDLTLFRTSYTTPYSFSQNVTSVIVPSFKKIYIESVIVENYVQNILTGQNPLFIQLKQFIKDETFLPSLLENQIIIRTFFIKSNDYKEKVVKTGALSPQIRQLYLNMKMPRFIWVTEISSPNYLLSPNKYERKIIGEIICDSTTSPDLPHIFLSIHLPGVLLIRYPNPDNEVKFYEIENDKPYRSYVR